MVSDHNRDDQEGTTRSTSTGTSTQAAAPNVQLPAASDVPCAVVRRRTAGTVSETVYAPADAAVIRFPFGSCRISVLIRSNWKLRGEAAAGSVQACAPGSISRSEWLCDGTELLLTVPNSYWRDRATRRMRLTMMSGRPRHHGDATLQQLAQMLTHCTVENAKEGFAKPLMMATLERLLAIGADGIDPSPTSAERRPLAPHRMAKLAKFVRENLDRPITLADMAAAVGISPMHFASQFRAATGKRPRHFLLEERIERAKFLICESALPLSAIAATVGFKTQAHFCTVFKHHAGVQPSRWRSTVLENKP